MQNKIFFFAIMMAAVSVEATHTAANADSLQFYLSGEKKAAYSLASLQATLPSHHVRISSPFLVHGQAGKTKNYEAFAVADVLNLAFGSSWKNAAYTGVVFVALDGYKSVSEVAKLLQGGGYIAYKDLDMPAGWEPIGSKNADPGPFYLLWSGQDQSTANAYPWPWQLAAIHLVQFEEQYPKVVPQGVHPDSPAWRGFQTFKGHCFRCHAMSQQGGTIGPDLNAPMTITDYRDVHQLKDFIKHPSKYRYSNMPDHPHFSDQMLDDLISYFQHKSKDPK
jgi:mono/diheme cytochrome c family protein